jgi:hypothetical protein
MSIGAEVGADFSLSLGGLNWTQSILSVERLYTVRQFRDDRNVLL